MVYTIKFTNTYKSANPADVIGYDLSTISPSLIVESTYIDHVSDLYGGSDGFVSIPLYKRNQFCMLPPNSSITIETENSQEFIYYNGLNIDNCHVSTSGGSGGGGSDDDLVKQMMSMRYDNNTLTIPDYVQTFETSSVSFSQYLNTIIIPEHVEIKSDYNEGYFSIVYPLDVLFDIGNKDIEYQVNRDGDRTFVETNYVMSLFLHGFDFDVSTIENRSTFNFGKGLDSYMELLWSLTFFLEPVAPVVSPEDPEYNRNGIYTAIHLMNDDFHIMILSQDDTINHNYNYIFDFTDTLPDDPENYIIFEWVAETNELRNSLTHDIDMNRSDKVYAYMSQEQFLTWINLYEPGFVVTLSGCEEVDEFEDESMIFDNCVYSGYGINSPNSRYLYKTTLSYTKSDSFLACITTEGMEPFQICNGRTRIYLDKNLVYFQAVI